MCLVADLTDLAVAGQINLKREKLELSPVYSTAMNHDGHKLGYIRLVNFSQHAAFDMRQAIDDLQVRKVCVQRSSWLLKSCHLQLAASL